MTFDYSTPEQTYARLRTRYDAGDVRVVTWCARLDATELAQVFPGLTPAERSAQRSQLAAVVTRLDTVAVAEAAVAAAIQDTRRVAPVAEERGAR